VKGGKIYSFEKYHKGGMGNFEEQMIMMYPVSFLSVIVLTIGSPSGEVREKEGSLQ